MIPQDFIQNLLSRIDVVEMIGRYVPLKKAGANFQACCPFHQEKSPSFTVSPTKQFYHCFGCGAHGTAIGFLMEFSGLGYVEAIQSLAHHAGLSVPQSVAVDVQRDRAAVGLVDVMQRVAQYYRQQLKASHKAIEYLKQRGLTGEIAAQFGVGYAPEGWKNLAQTVENYADTVLVEAGLVVTGDANQRYDRFRDRIMFPIHSTKGQVIGFGGRVIGQGEPKYLNSPETVLFQKGQQLYGLYQARRAIRDANKVVVVEGYMDVLALAQHGIGYAVATLGTATTAMHVQLLLRYSDEVVFCFDGDAAGQRAAWRALEQSLPVLTDVSKLGFLFLPETHDPDSYVREFGQAGLVEMLTHSTMSLSVYLFRQMSQQHDLNQVEGRSSFLRALQPLVKQVTAPGLALMLRRRTAELAHIEIAELVQLWQITTPRRGLPVAPRGSRPAPAPVSRNLLRLLLFKPELAVQISAAWLTNHDQDSVAVQQVLEILQQHPNLDSVALFEMCKHLPTVDVIAQRMADLMEWDAQFDVTADFELVIQQMQNAQRQTQLQLLAQKSLSELSEAEKQVLRQPR